MDADKCLTLPEDLLLDIFRRLETTAVIRCAGVCRPWRRAIIANASSLRPRPDRFLPDLLLGFLDKYTRFPLSWQLQYVPASSNTEVPCLFTPATGVSVRIDGRLYDNLLSSRDGFLLLGESTVHKSLCLCMALTGACKVFPAAASSDGNYMGWMYDLATGYDVEVEDHSGDEVAVWTILAVKCLGDSKDGMMYQIFSSTSGAWGPVRCSAKFPEDVAYVMSSKPSSLGGTVVVCHGVVSWFVDLCLFSDLDVVNRRSHMCLFSVDLRTERSWTTELPDFGTLGSRLVLAVSEDGKLSLALLSLHRMEVWVLVGDGQWMLRTIDDVQKLLPGCLSMDHMWLSGFCPRSGYLFGAGRDDQNKKVQHHFIIGVDGRSPRLIGSVESSNSDIRFPYEMDCSTYISKMKYF